MTLVLVLDAVLQIAVPTVFLHSCRENCIKESTVLLLVVAYESAFNTGSFSKK